MNPQLIPIQKTMRMIKIVGTVLCLLAFEAQAFDVIKVDQAVKKLFQSFFARGFLATDCAFSYSYESIHYVKDSERYPEFQIEYFPNDVNVTLEEVDFCTRSDGYWVTLRYTNGEYEVIGYSSFSQADEGADE